METLEYQPEKAHQRYILKDGSEVTGASTISKVDDEASNTLIGWANRLGIQGINCWKAREQTADIGNVAHFMIQCHFQRKIPDFKKMSQAAIETGTKVFEKFMNWWADNDLKFIVSEKEMVSEEFKYGGTLDLAAVDHKERIILIDLKTSKGVYWGHKCQLAGLGRLWIENIGGTVHKHIIARLPREDKKTEIYDMQNPEEMFAVFLTQLAYTNAKHKAGGYAKS